MSLTSAQLKRMAEILRVDQVREVFGYDTYRVAYRVALRVGSLWEKVEIELRPSLLTGRGRDPAAVLDVFVKILFDAALRLRMRAEQEEFEAFLIYKAKTICSVFGISRELIGIVDPDHRPNPKPLDRFSAVAKEIEDL